MGSGMIAVSIGTIGLALILLFLRIPMKVLIIELEKTLRQSLSNFMERNDFDVVVADSLREGASLFNKAAVDMVICGDRLPDGSGLEILKEWGVQNPKLISILMTVRKDDRLEQEATKAGIKGYLEKPFDLKRLEELIGLRVSKEERR